MKNITYHREWVIIVYSPFPFLNKYVFDKLPLREISNKFK